MSKIAPMPPMLSASVVFRSRNRCDFRANILSSLAQLYKFPANPLMEAIATLRMRDTDALRITSVSRGGDQLLVAFVRNGEPLDALVRAKGSTAVTCVVFDTDRNQLAKSEDIREVWQFCRFLTQST